MSAPHSNDVALMCTQVMADGVMSKERMEQLMDMREKLGLTQEAAGKIIKGVQSQRLIGGLQVRSGVLTSLHSWQLETPQHVAACQSQTITCTYHQHSIPRLL